MLRYVPMIVALGFLLYCFFDVLATDRRRFRSLNKFAWLLVVLLPVIGALLWLLLGRPRRAPRAAVDQVIHLRRKERPLAPDDDPAFLRVLDERAWRAKREAMRASENAEAPDPDPGAAGPDAAEPAPDPPAPDPEEPATGADPPPP